MLIICSNRAAKPERKLAASQEFSDAIVVSLARKGIADVDFVFSLLYVEALEQRPIKPTASARKACNKVFFRTFLFVNLFCKGSRNFLLQLLCWL